MTLPCYHSAIYLSNAPSPSSVGHACLLRLSSTLPSPRFRRSLRSICSIASCLDHIPAMPLRDEPVRNTYATPSPAEKHIHPAPIREHANSDSSTLSQIKTHEYNPEHDMTPSTVQHGHNLFHTPQRMSTQSRHLTKLQSLRDRLGLTPEAPLDDQALVHDEDGKELWWPHIRYLLREPFAEFWGTFVMILFGDGVVAQVLLTTGSKTAPGGDGFGNYQSISWW